MDAREAAAGAVAALACLALTALLHGDAVRQHEARRDAELLLRSTEISAEVVRRMDTYEQVLRGVQGLLSRGGSLAPGDLRAYLESLRLDLHHPGLRSVGIARPVPAARLAAHEAAMRALGLPDYAVHPSSPDKIRVPVIQLEPLTDGKRAVLGFDMWADPERRGAMERSRDEGRARLTGRITLVNDREPGAQASVLLYVPVYRQGEAADTEAERRASHVSWVFAPFRMGDFMTGILGSREAEEAIEIFDGPERSPRSLMFRSSSYPDATVPGTPDIVRPIVLFGREWTMVLRARPGHAGALPSAAPAIGAGGIVASVLAGLLVAGLVRSRRLARAALESENRFRVMADQAPVLIWLTDRDGRLTWCNSAYARFTGRDAAPSPDEPWREAVHEEDRDRLDEAMRRATPGTGPFEFRLRRADGDHRWMLGACAPREGGVGGTIGSCTDITERRRADALLLARFEFTASAPDASLDELLQGVLDRAESLTGSTIGFFHFVDPDGENLQLQTWSTNTLAHMCKAEGKGMHYPLSHAGVWADCVKARAPVIHNDYEALAHKRGMPKGHARVVRELTVPVERAGRIVAILGVGNRPTPYGQADADMVLGLATLAMDLVDAKRGEERMRQADAVFRHTQEGVTVTDPEERILMVNRAFTQITGYGEDEVLGQTPRLLASGRQDKAFYEAMWGSIERTGAWQGEIWNRRKDGTVYPEWLGINAVRDARGRLTHYVGVFSDISQLKISEARLDFLAHHDPLTELPNRRLFGSRLDHALRLAERHGHGLSLLMLDLDRFKDVNDSLGHPAGDELLVAVAARLKARVRAADTLARLGGDEFAVLLERPEMADSAECLAQSLIDALAAPFPLSCGERIAIGVSVGISEHPSHGRTAADLMQHADAALYKAKAEGRNLLRRYSEALTDEARDRLHLESRLRRAIDEGGIDVHFQPIVEIATGRVVGAEALARWTDGEAGPVPPSRFIAVAEQTGAIAALGDAVLRRAVAQAARWTAQGLPPIDLSVNVSPRQFETGDFAGRVLAIADEAGLDPGRLVVELTESALLGDVRAVAEGLARLRAGGVRVAIDDFGTGHSSLARLQELPIDTLKIDRRFIVAVPGGDSDRRLAEAIIRVAQALGLTVLAEGVESEAQLDWLRGEGCHLYQGYLNARPLDPAAFARHLARGGVSAAPREPEPA